MNEEKNQKINFEIGSQSLENDAEYQRRLAEFNAEHYTKEKKARYFRRKIIISVIVACIIAVVAFFSSRYTYIINIIVVCSLSLVLLLLFFITPKFDEISFRKNKFARENNLLILPNNSSKSENSAFDQIGAQYVNFYRFHRFKKENLEFGYAHYETGGKSSTHYYTFYVEETLPFWVQNLVIDSRVTSSLKVENLHKAGLLKLEGDFHNYFEIETEENHKMEATTFLAPDLMAALIDNFIECDIEFFDNKVRFYFYADDPDVANPEAFFGKMSKNFTIAEKFLNEFRNRFIYLKKSDSSDATRKITSNDPMSEWPNKILFLSIITLFMSFYIALSSALNTGSFDNIVGMIAIIVFFASIGAIVVATNIRKKTNRVKSIYAKFIPIWLFLVYAIISLAVKAFGGTLTKELYRTPSSMYSNSSNKSSPQKTESTVSKNEEKKADDKNLTMSGEYKFNKVYYEILRYKKEQGGNLDWDDPVHFENIKARLPEDVARDFKTSRNVVGERGIDYDIVYIHRGQSCDGKYFEFHNSKTSLYIDEWSPEKSWSNKCENI